MDSGVGLYFLSIVRFYELFCFIFIMYVFMGRNVI